MELAEEPPANTGEQFSRYRLESELRCLLAMLQSCVAESRLARVRRSCEVFRPRNSGDARFCWLPRDRRGAAHHHLLEPACGWALHRLAAVPARRWCARHHARRSANDERVGHRHLADQWLRALSIRPHWRLIDRLDVCDLQDPESAHGDRRIHR